jgi:SAM-dependent methyltransferase
MRDLVSRVGTQLGDLRGKIVLDIGCNDGSLLSIFGESGASTFGIEPTGAAEDASARGHVVVNGFLSDAVAAEFVRAHGHPDIITFTNVFAHIEDLGGVVRALKVLASRTTTLVIENHYLGSILAGNQFDTFYHEHPRTYSYTSFTYIADALGMRITNVEFPRRYGGNIRVFMNACKEGERHLEGESLHAKESSFGSDLSRLAAQIETWRTKKRAELKAEVGQHGKLHAKAFPGRAAIPIKMLGLNETQVVAAYEKPGSGKIGHYIPGTRIPIVSDDDFPLADGTDGALLNLAWHIRDEIKSYMQQRGFRGRIIDIIAPEDFAGAA